MSKKVMTVMALLVLVSACRTQTGVQGEYIAMRDVCQGQAETRFSSYVPDNAGGNVKDRNAELVSLFSDCMFEGGWSVGTPKRKDEKETASIIADPQQPWNQSSARASAPVAGAQPTAQLPPPPSILPTPSNLPAQTTARPSAPVNGAPSRYMPVENQQLIYGTQPAAPVSRVAPSPGANQFYAYPSNFKADSGVGVGASVKPGREFTE